MPGRNDKKLRRFFCLLLRKKQKRAAPSPRRKVCSMQQRRNPTIDIALGGMSAAKPAPAPLHGYAEVFAMVNRHHEQVKQLHRSALAAAAQPAAAKKAR